MSKKNVKLTKIKKERVEIFYKQKDSLLLEILFKKQKEDLLLEMLFDREKEDLILEIRNLIKEIQEITESYNKIFEDIIKN